MRTSKRGAFEIAASEGIVINPYLDSVGVWTYGVGHTVAAGAPDPAAMEYTPHTSGNFSHAVKDAMTLFMEDLRKYERDVERAIGGYLPRQHEFDAMVSFHYNTGAIGRATFVKTLKAGDREKAIKQIMNWKKPPEIIPRRQGEQLLFRTGQYSHNSIPIYDATVDGKLARPAFAILSYVRFCELFDEGLLLKTSPVGPPPLPRKPTLLSLLLGLFRR